MMIGVFVGIDDNQISQIVLPSQDLPNLKELEMRGNLLCEVSGKIPQSLEKLYLAENKIERLILDDVSTLINLEVLHVRNNKIQKLHGFTEKLAKLKYLNLRQNNISKIRQFRKLQCLPSLEILIFLQNPISGDIEETKRTDNDEEEIGEDQEPLDPNRIAILAILPDLKRINKTPVTFDEREKARINRDQLINQIMEDESSDDENGEPRTSQTTKTTEMVHENTSKSHSIFADQEESSIMD